MVELKKAQVYLITSLILIIAFSSYFAITYLRPAREVSPATPNCFLLYNELNELVDSLTYNNQSSNYTSYMIRNLINNYTYSLPYSNVKIFVFLSSDKSYFFSNFGETHVLLSDGLTNQSFYFVNHSSIDMNFKEVYLDFNGFFYPFYAYNSSAFSSTKLINVFMYSNVSGNVYVCSYGPKLIIY